MHLRYFFICAISIGMMTPSEARQLLNELELSQVELSEEMGKLTGRAYSKQTVNAWFREGGRGPSDACVIFLRMEQRRRADASEMLGFATDQLVRASSGK
ncbi:hypothetical protein [Henriciella sp.]|uniref:hypothetical protein n=1 Tax=Henriciella sp. TaxID=1968823 RepID=UPI0026319281|nr:hypothetical protein [Henriciella sp.]